jgi:DNA invertase Pin-like site-specific DNA recombinase
VFYINKSTTKKASNPKTRHTLDFALPLPASTISNQQVCDKAKVRETIFKLRAEGLSYREIAKVIGLHFTRVRQILLAEARRKK